MKKILLYSLLSFTHFITPSELPDLIPPDLFNLNSPSFNEMYTSLFQPIENDFEQKESKNTDTSTWKHEIIKRKRESDDNVEIPKEIADKTSSIFFKESSYEFITMSIDKKNISYKIPNFKKLYCSTFANRMTHNFFTIVKHKNYIPNEEIHAQLRKKIHLFFKNQTNKKTLMEIVEKLHKDEIVLKDKQKRKWFQAKAPHLFEEALITETLNFKIEGHETPHISFHATMTTEEKEEYLISLTTIINHWTLTYVADLQDHVRKSIHRCHLKYPSIKKYFDEHQAEIAEYITRKTRYFHEFNKTTLPD